MKLILVFLFFANCVIAQTWMQLTDLPALERDDGVSKVINNKAYFGSGLRNGFTLGGDFYELNLSTNTWSIIASMPNGAERQYAVAFTYSNYFFIHGGSGIAGALFTDTYRYNVSMNNWTTVASKPGSAVMAASSFTLNNKAYVVSGRFANNNVSDEVWEYDMATNVWVQKNNFPFGGRWRASAATLNGAGYLMFGKDGNGSYRKEIYKYNQLTDTWLKVADFPQAKGRYYVGVQAVGNKLLSFGGIDTLDNYYNDCWFFDDVSNTFSQGPSLPSFGRKGGLSCATGNKFYYSCGVTATVRLKETWVLDAPVGLREYEKEDTFLIYPNPCNDLLQINSNGKNFNGMVKIFDCFGQVVFDKQFNTSEEKSIDLTSLTKGIYFLKFIEEGITIETKKLIKE